MDDKGFIFTTDATLALVVVIVLTTSIISYQLVPVYMGEDHQHLEALADSILLVLDQEGSLRQASALASMNSTGVVYARGNLTQRLSALIPPGIGYKLTLDAPNQVVVQYDGGLSYSNDVVTRVRVISGPKQGYVGRAWYKVEKFEMVPNTQNVTTTLWNFHNWLTNFNPWNGGLNNFYYWGTNSRNQRINIPFSIPNDATILGAKYLIGCDNKNNNISYSTNTTINGINYAAYKNQFTFLNNRPGTSGSNTEKMYNYQGNITTGLVPGVNNFNVRFWNMSNNQRYDLPWFSIIGHYSTTYPVPNGILNTTFNFPDAAGLAVQSPQDLDGNGVANEYGRIYNLNTGSVTSFSNQRVVSWTNMLNQNHGFDNGIPFVVTDVNGDGNPYNGQNDPGSAVSIVKDVYIPAPNKIFDSFVVINAYGGVDCALVEVWNGTAWNTVFCSFDLYQDGGWVDYSDRGDGYGNIPGIINIPVDELNSKYLAAGRNNKVRITIWDDVPGADYDLVGLTNCYVTTTYSNKMVKWINFPYESHQSGNNVETQQKTFSVLPGNNAREVLLFVGAGTDSRTITVSYPSGQVLYSGSIPYYLNIASLDASKGFHVITTDNSTETQYYLRGDDDDALSYDLIVSVTGPGNAWESGDWNSNAEIFSGTRIAVLYPEALINVWNESYSLNAEEAMNLARVQLANNIGVSVDDPAIRTEALNISAMPNQIPVRLELWKH